MRILASLAAVSLVIASFALLASYGALAQASAWTQMSPATAPSGRAGHAMAYHSGSDRVILFGGETAPGSNVLNDETWAYDLNANTWENRNPSPRPSARFAHAMAYDADSERAILFGGWTGTGQSKETWAYDYNANTWTNKAPTTSPSVGVFVNMAYDASADRIVLFGGGTDRFLAGAPDETWAYDFDSNTWTRRNPSESPLPRGGHVMAYDAPSDRIVVFGGRDGTTDFGDTWAYDYDGDRWIRMDPETSPSPRHGAAMAYDADADRAVCMGGTDGGDETWIYDVDGDVWTLVDKGSGPSSRFGARVAYDTESGLILLFGGSSGGDETWSHRFISPPPPFPWPLVAAAVGVAVAAAVAALLLVRRRRRKIGEQSRP